MTDTDTPPALDEAGAAELLRARRTGEGSTDPADYGKRLEPPRSDDGTPLAGIWRPARADDDEGEAFKGDSDALAYVQEREAARREAVEAQAEVERAEADAKAERHVRQPTTLTDDDKVALEGLKQRVAQYHEREQALQQAADAIQRNPQVATAENRRKVEEAAKALQAEREQLEQAGQIVQRTAIQRAAEGQRRQLHREFPELANQETRARLIEFARSKGIPEARARAETDPATVGMWFKAMQAEDAKADRERRRQETAQWADRAFGRTPGADPIHDADEALERVRRTGRPDDGLLAMTLRRRERGSD